MKLFISHSEKDAAVAKSLVKMLYEIGLKEDDMFCSSVAEIGIPIKEDIFEYLSNMFNNESLYVIYLLSNHYYESAACLNEMGAAWVKRTEYLTFLMPGYEYNSIKGAINPNKISIKLDDESSFLKHRLGDFKDDLLEKYSLSLSQTRWENIRDTFINSIDAALDLTLINSEGFCIGDDNNDGCQIDQASKSNTELTAFIDFDKTTSDLCSIVVFLDENNWSRFVANNKYLSFEVYVEDTIESMQLEFQIPSMGRNIKRSVLLNAVNYIKLQDLNKSSDKWGLVREINFLIHRKQVNCNKGKVVIRNLKITD